MSDKFIDLHIHTNYSDGFDSIDQVLKKAKDNGVKVLSLTEHYNLSSYEEAVSIAKDYDIEVIPGIEIGADMSKYHEGKKHVCHILGYFVSKDICKLLDLYEMDRYDCVVKTIKLLNHLGIEITLQDVIKYAKDKKSIGRFDIARTLKEKGYVKSTAEAYGKYLDHKGKSYVRRNKLDPVSLVKKIREYGGVPVLAHPKSLRFDIEREEAFIKELVEAGLCGIEVYNPNNGKERRNTFLKYCEDYNLIPTVGSDYHGGKRKPVITIGHGIDDNLLISDYSIVQRIKNKHQEIEKDNQ